MLSKSRNKRAMELSINFIVMLILALVVFGMGLVLFKNFFMQAEDIKKNLDEQTRRELLDKMMSSPEQVVVYPTTLTVQKGKGEVIGVGVLHIQGINNFRVDSNFEKAYNRDGDEMPVDPGCSANPALCPINVVSSINRSIELNKREIIELPLRVQSNAATGKYSVKITVKQSGTALSTNLVYINVP